jgi:acylphosphatase
MPRKIARRYIVSGRVQGVGYRAFAQWSARAAGVTGWARNLADGDVEIHANGTPAELDAFEARLRQGPRFADVRSVQVQDAPVSDAAEFTIR